MSFFIKQSIVRGYRQVACEISTLRDRQAEPKATPSKPLRALLLSSFRFIPIMIYWAIGLSRPHPILSTLLGPPLLGVLVGWLSFESALALDELVCRNEN